MCPGRCGSVDRVTACESKGRWFDARSGHMPGLQQVPNRGRVRGNHTLLFLSLPRFLPPFPLSKNK